jgi:hypothetical protein
MNMTKESTLNQLLVSGLSKQDSSMRSIVHEPDGKVTAGARAGLFGPSFYYAAFYGSFPSATIRSWTTARDGPECNLAMAQVGNGTTLECELRLTAESS